MATKTVEPRRISNVNGNDIPYRAMTNVSALTPGASGVATWGSSNPGSSYQNAIAGKNGSRRCPSRIDCTNYQAELPANARVTAIGVQYHYDKVSYSSETAYPDIRSPTIDLLGVNVGAKTGNAPPRATASNKTFSVSWTGLNLKGSDVNKTDFGVAFKLPCNRNDDPGYIRMSYLRVVITYVAENYIPTITSSPQSAVYGNKFTATFKIKESNKAIPSANVSAQITIPSGLQIVRVISVNGSFNSSNKTWTAKTSNYSATLQLELSTISNSTGAKNLKITIGSNSSQKTITILPITYSCSATISGNTLEIPSNNPDEAQTLYLNLNFGKNSPIDFYTSINININIPDSLQISDSNISSKIVGGVYTIQANNTNNGWINNKNTLTIPLIGVTEGEYDITISSPNITGSYTFHVIVTMPEPTSGLYYGAFQLPQFSYDNMIDGETYVFGCFAKYNGNNIINGAKNLKIVCLNGDSVSWSEKVTSVDTWEFLEIEFEYNSMFSVEIQMYGDYLDYGNGTPLFSNFILMEKSYYNDKYQTPALFLEPLENLLETSEEESSLMFEPPEKISSTEHYLSDFNLTPLKEAHNIKIQGLAVEIDVDFEQETGVTVGLGTKGEKKYFYESSSNVSPETYHLTFGGKYENWTIPFKDLPEFLNNVELVLQLDDDHELDNPCEIKINNISLVIYYSEDIATQCGFSIDDIHCKYFNINWLNNKLPEGAEWDVNLLKIDGGDGAEATRANIKDKSIELEIEFEEDNFKDLQNLKDYVIDYFTPLRDRLNKPIPKKLVFDHQDDRYYSYILNNTIDLESTGGSLKGSVELVIPDGLSRSLNLVRSEDVGNVKSLSKVEPVVELILGANPDKKPVVVKEAYTGQKVILTGRDLGQLSVSEPDLNRLASGTRIRIDSENLVVSYKENEEWKLLPIENIDLSSTFFIIQNDFDFKSESEYCTINEVSYYTKH
ncbi:MAG: phage tail family protein [Lachnospiraceae bacterium]|jgi:predicted phage tail component-like protein|nr:phage tail family protein [Lachnospiraceae bacterium]